MRKMKIKIKKFHDDAVTPSYAKPGDAGMDLTVTEVKKEGLFKVTYFFGFGMELPKNHYAAIVPRSSVRKTFQWLSNSYGVIDSGYRGELQATFYRIPFISTIYEVGDRAVQMIVKTYKRNTFEEVLELSESERGTGGFGSTGNK